MKRNKKYVMRLIKMKKTARMLDIYGIIIKKNVKNQIWIKAY